MLLDNIALFLTIVEKGSLTAAGRAAGLSPTTVSERLAALEAHYGTALLHRTTRALSLTDEGRTLLDGAKHLLGEAADLEARIRHGAETLSGPIRISAPRDSGARLISDAVGAFLDRHPAISVEFLLSDGYLDIVGQGIDLAVRFGEIVDSTLRIRRLKPKRRLVCAAPRYLDAHGAPERPSDLTRHNCLVMRFGATLDNAWRLGQGENQEVVIVRGNRVADDSGLVWRWGLAGHGIMMKTELDVAADLAAGRLVELLPDFAPPARPIQLLYPPGRDRPRRVQALADHLADAIDAAGL